MHTSPPAAQEAICEDLEGNNQHKTSSMATPGQRRPHRPACTRIGGRQHLGQVTFAMGGGALYGWSRLVRISKCGNETGIARGLRED
jgi:hypothetical protein